MPKTFYVVAMTTPPTMPLPAGSMLLTVTAKTSGAAIRVANERLDSTDRDGEVTGVQES